MPSLEVRSERGVRGYWVGDTQYPRVTAVLDAIHKPALERWKLEHEQKAFYESAVKTFDECVASGTCSSIRFRTMMQHDLNEAKKAERAQMAAAEAGTRVHAHIAARLRGETRPDDLSETELIQSDYAVDWMQEVGAVPVAIEEAVYWDANGRGFAGTPDVVVDFPDTARVVVDWKTGAGKVWNSYHLQNVAYRRAWNWMHKAEITRPCTGGMIVRLPQAPDEPVEVVPVVGENELFLVFLACLRIYEWSKEE